MIRIKRWLSIQKHKNARLILLLGIVLFNIVLWLVSSLLAYAISPDSYGSVPAALWKSGITWMLEPGFYDPNVAVPIRIISIVVIVTSLITFTGGIIGYVADFFSSIIESSESGKDKLFIYNHVLILNWNSKALELIADYLYDDEVNNVVILSDRGKEEIEKLISRKLYEMEKGSAKLNVLVREGDVFSKSDLNSVCIEKARTVIILSDSDDGRDIDAVDMCTVKTLMLVANSEISRDIPIIVEARKEETVEVIRERIAKNLNAEDRIIPILPDEMMGRLIAQTLLFPEVNNAYQELFSFKGSEFYSAAEGDIGKYLNTHNKAIPIYNHNGCMYVLSDNDKNLNSLRSLPLSSARKVKIEEKSSYKDKNIIVFGSNNKLKYITESLELYAKDSGTRVLITHVESNDAGTISNSVKDIKKIDSILILSSDGLERKDYDSDVLLTLLMIQDIAKLHKADIIIELLDPKHYDIAKSYNIRNTIISNKYISRIMTQLGKCSRLYYLFLDLLTYDANVGEGETYELYAFSAGNFFSEVLPMQFKSQSELITSCYFSSGGAYMVIGMVKGGETRIFKGDLDGPEDISIAAEDKLIVICK